MTLKQLLPVCRVLAAQSWQMPAMLSPALLRLHLKCLRQDWKTAGLKQLVLSPCLGELTGAATSDMPVAAISADLRQRALPPAAHLAAALLDWWRRPEQQQQDALALAQAAAGRCCAYLRCANLGGEGGPAAGQGVGSMRCRCEGVGVGRAAEVQQALLSASNVTHHPPLSTSPRPRSACRAVWYCGTACSHADWRQGGHRRVCKALGAARAAAKAARVAAAAEASAVAAGD